MVKDQCIVEIVYRNIGNSVDDYLKYKTYPKMKDSGIERIGKMPEPWTKIILKYAWRIQKGKIPSKTYDKEKNGNIPYLSMDFLRNSSNTVYVKNNDGIEVNDGDLLILYDGSNAGEVLKGKHGILSSTMGVLNQIDRKFESQYFFYQLKFLETDIQNNTVGMGIPHIDGNYLRNLELILPSKIEQKQISEYLEKKIKKIELEIKNNQKLIQYLEGKKNAQIKCSITKGLDSTVQMKETGVKWIGKIPEHWEITKLNYFYETQLGKMLQPESRANDDILIQYLNTDFVEWDFIDLINLPKMWINPSHVFKYQIKKNDLLICEGGSYPGRSAIVSEVNDTIIVQNALHRIRPKEKSTNGFLYYIMYCARKSGWIDMVSNKTTMGHLTQEKLRNLKIALPDKPEQKIIFKNLDKIITDIDFIISRIENQIKRLQEHCDSTISLVITGKICVTN
jgi:type I restriction enzyme, S subunit